ncbi:unnamed protein product [Parajaminaea phylloscopi]
MALTGSLPPSLPSKKRNAAHAKGQPSEAKQAKPSSSKKGPVDFTTRCNELQSTLSSSADLNPLADLINLIKEEAYSLNSSTVVPALSLTVRTFSHLLQHGSLQPWPVSRATGWLIVKEEPQPEEVVHNWLKARFNEAICLLANLLLTHPKEKTRLASLKALMELQRVVTELQEGTASWSECPWRAVTDAVMGARCAPDPAGTAVRVTEALGLETTRAVFLADWVEGHLDVKLAFLRTLKAVVPGLVSRSDALAMLIPLTNPPTTKTAIKGGQFLVQSFATAPVLRGEGASSKKAGRSRKAKRKFTQDGDSDEEQGTGSQSDQEMEEEDLNWFSDSGDEGQAETQLTEPTKFAGSGSGASRKRRRGGAASLPFHESLYDTKAWKALSEAAWLTIILGASPKTAAAAAAASNAPQAGSGLSLSEINTVLRIMEKRVLPFLSRPQLIADWLMDCLDMGGAAALLSLQPLFTLYVSASLSLPTLYTTLYTLLTPALLHSPHRSHSLRLIYLFLSSEKLSLAIVAAFVKRLARCALRGPPGGIIPVVVVTYNLLKRHKEGMALLHREGNSVDDELKPFVDPYDDDLTIPPASTHALESCLYEFVSLGAQPSNANEASLQAREMESHYHAATSTIVRMLAQPFTKESYDVEEFLDHSYSTLLATEFKRLLNEQGLAGQEAPTKRARQAPPPAVRFSIPGTVTSVAKDGVSKRVKLPGVFPSRKSLEAQEPPAAGQDEVLSGEEDDEGVNGDALGLDPNEPGLDAEEREAREAMRMVEVENRRRARQEERARRQKLAQRKTNSPMALWRF